jgi:hypothetical protein
MYFACTPPRIDLAAEALRTSFQKRQAGDDSLRLHAVVDCAFDAQLTSLARRSGAPVGKGSRLDALKEHLPYICPLEAPPALQAIEDLFAKARGCPMLSFIAAPVDAAVLAGGLQRLLIARTEDDTRWPLRFADTRVLPILLDELNAPQGDGARLLAEVAAWWWPGRDGTLGGRSFAFRTPGVASSDEDASELAVDEAQFARMMNAAQPDAIIAQLHQACPDILNGRLPHENHAHVRAALDLLPPRGFDGAGLQLRWAAIGLGFGQDPRRVAVLTGAVAESATADDLLARIDRIVAELP